MDQPRLTKTRFRDGLWEGLLTGLHDAADLSARFRDRELPLRADRAEEEGGWRVALPIPADILGDGVHTILFTLPDGTVLDRIAILSGELLSGDLLAEVSLLRAEISVMKRALQRIGRGQPGAD